jgi:hypothetical protein
MSGERFADLQSGFWIPQADRSITTPAGKKFPIRAESHAIDTSAMTGKGFAYLQSSFWIPQADRSVITPAGKKSSIRAEGHAIY